MYTYTKYIESTVSKTVGGNQADPSDRAAGLESERIIAKGRTCEEIQAEKCSVTAADEAFTMDKVERATCAFGRLSIYLFTLNGLGGEDEGEESKRREKTEESEKQERRERERRSPGCGAAENNSAAGVKIICG